MGNVLKKLLHGHVVLNDVSEELLSVGPCLGAGPRRHVLLHLLPVLAVGLQRFQKAHVFHH